jgi:hypothetical protein
LLGDPVLEARGASAWHEAHDQASCLGGWLQDRELGVADPGDLVARPGGCDDCVADRPEYPLARPAGDREFLDVPRRRN